MSDHLDNAPSAFRLPQRYGRITALASVPAGGNASHSANDAARFFARRGVPIEASPTAGGGVSLSGRVDPSRHGLFRDVLSQWAAEVGSVAKECAEAESTYDGDDGGFEHACAREERCQAHLDRICRDLGFPVVPGEGGRWAQAVGGACEHIAPLAEAFSNLRLNGRISRFPNRAITVARQGTCSPYGLPAVLLKLKGTCRVFSERVGLRLLEGSPRVIAVTEVAPAVILVENTPPLDNIWDETRFWAAWQNLAPDAWDFIEAWAAVRVLRYVEAGGREWKFYNHTHSPLNVVARADELPVVPRAVAIEPSRVTARWIRRRCCEIALALQLGAGSDSGLRRHVIGHLATPYPFLEPIGAASRTVAEVEQCLAKAASALHWELLCDENQGSNAAFLIERRQLAASACVGLRSLLTSLLALDFECRDELWDDSLPADQSAPSRAACDSETGCVEV